MGVDGLIIAVEVDSAAGLPAFDIVGLPDTAVRESKERVRTAIRNSGIQLRQEKVTINLAPAGIRKDSPGLDLPIAVGLLAAYGVVPADCLQTSFFAAELSLEGECRPVRGILPMVIAAREKGLTSVFVARGNANEALLVEGVTVYVIDCLHEVVQIYSIAGLLPAGGGLVQERPFRSPHHTTSMVAMIGGGSVPRPGEVTLAHHGVLFLDELPEFSKATLEVLRQPLEDRAVTISRVHATLTFPSSMILICAMNPCPCGYFGDESGGRSCECSPSEIRRYTRKISGPLLDRIDIHIRVPRVAYQELASKRRAEDSATIRGRVERARQRQLARLQPYGRFCNAQMNHTILRETCHLTGEAQSLLEMAFRRMSLSARSYDRIIKVARTIADLETPEDGAEAAAVLGPQHIAEAIGLRSDIGLAVE